jgi:hypothetical protein
MCRRRILVSSLLCTACTTSASISHLINGIASSELYKGLLWRAKKTARCWLLEQGAPHQCGREARFVGSTVTSLQFAILSSPLSTTTNNFLLPLPWFDRSSVCHLPSTTATTGLTQSLTIDWVSKTDDCLQSRDRVRN